MSISVSIPKDPVYLPSMDWQFLRREGIRHIERMGSALWTDYNLHDPGITLLEILCYAITDLGYRTNMPVEDLFSENGNAAFYSAIDILPNGPVTALDFRKILVDIPGVQNAWVEQADEPEVNFRLTNLLNHEPAMETMRPYFERLDFELTNLPVPEPDQAKLKAMFGCKSEKDKQIAREAFMTDLYDKIPLDNDVLIKVFFVYMADKYFPEAIAFLDSELAEAISDERRQSSVKTIRNQLKIIRGRLQKKPFQYDFDDPDLVGLLKENTYPSLINFFYKDPLLCLLLAGSLQHTAAGNEATDYNLFIPQGVYSVSLLLDQDAQGHEQDILAEARRRLHANRNLSEDFLPGIHLVERIRMGVELCIEADPSYDPLAVIAAAYQAIEGYLTPEVKFYSLEQLLNRYAVFEIDGEVRDALREAFLPEELVSALLPLEGQKLTGDETLQKAIALLWDEESIENYYDDLFLHTKKTYDADRVYNGPVLQHGFIDEKEFAKAQPRQTVFRSDLFQVISAVDGVLKIEKLELFKCDQPGSRRGNWCISFPCRCLPVLSADCSDFCVMSNSIDVPVDTEMIRQYLETHPHISTKLDRHDMLDMPIPKGRPVNDLTKFTSTQEDFPRTYKIGRTGLSRNETKQRHAQATQLKGYLFVFDQLMANYLSQLSATGI